MRTILLAFAAAAALSAAPALAAPPADPDAPVFDNGPVWVYTEVKTVDGHFDDYMHWLASQWRNQEEALKKAGIISDYKVLLASAARENEGDILLAVQYPNMAAFDRSVADEYAMQKRIFGPLAKASSEQAARGAIRTIKSDYMFREARFR